MEPMWWRRNGTLEFNAARFCGYTSSGLKKSVKIIAADHLETLLKQPKPGGINILSQKDVRLYSTSYDGRNSWRVQPVTSVSDRLFILHDADICLSPVDHKGHRYASFGCTIDMLLTGRWVHLTRNAAMFPEYAIRKYAALHGIWIPQDWTTIFSRNTRFPDSFRKDLCSRGWGALLPPPSSAPFAMRGNLFWPDSTYLDNIVNYPNVRHDVFQDGANESIITYPNLSDEEQWVSTPVVSQFSINSTAMRLSSIHDPQILVFRKQSSQWEAELLGASRLRMLGSRIHQPLHTDPAKGTIYYPWFPGTTVADLRAQYFGLASASSSKANELFKTILDAEMRKAEDILALYYSTLSQQQSETNIQRFFCDRIPNGRRMRHLYPHGLTIGETNYGVDQILSWSMKVNGKQYPSLHSCFEEALAKLSVDEITVVGFGDGHGGNILVGGKGESSAETLRYVDYEAAGRHSPWLDMAKPIYNDVFYSIFYADLLGKDLFADGTVKVKVQEDDGVDISFTFSPDELTYGIWQVKKRFILDPFVHYLKAQGHKTDDWNRKLGLALLCCAVLTRSFQAREDLFFANLALGAILSQWDGSDIFDF